MGSFFIQFIIFWSLIGSLYVSPIYSAEIKKNSNNTKEAANLNSFNFRKHLVAYGGLDDKYLNQIANSIDTLIIGEIDLYKIKKLREINPEIRIYKYFNAIGLHPTHRLWEMVNSNENWFVHDQTFKNRLIARKYGWYLLDLSSVTLRQFLINKIKKMVSSSYDGVFLDDFWVQFLNKFNPKYMTVRIAPKVSRDWQVNMKTFLKELRISFNKEILINGAYKEYAEYVDGLFHEGFIHSNNQKGDYFKTISESTRELNKIKTLKKYGKKLFIHSGVNDSDDLKVKHIYDLCLGSYLLICDKNTSFGFQQGKSYYFKGFYNEFKSTMEKNIIPVNDFYQKPELSQKKNLMKNGEFDQQFKHWNIISGTPTLEGDKDLYVKINGNNLEKDAIKSEFISVKSQKKYYLYVDSKCVDNFPTGREYNKFGIRGRFFDLNYKQINKPYDLQIDRGSFDWQPFETHFISPNKSSFFQFRIGYLSGGTGTGWIDNIFFSEQPIQQANLKRDFVGFSVIVNLNDKRSFIRYK